MRPKLIAVCLLTLSTTNVSAGGPASELLKSGGRYVIGRTARAAVKEGAEQAAKRTTAKLSREAAEATARRATARAIRHFGDDAVKATARTAGKATSLADDLAKASGRLTAQNQRRLLMLQPDLKQSGATGEVVHMVASAAAPDEMIERLWKHRGKIAAGAAVTAVLLHGDDLAMAGDEFIAKPAIESTAQHVVAPIVKQVGPLGIGVIGISVVLAPVLLVAVWLKSRRLTNLLSLIGVARARMRR